MTEVATKNIAKQTYAVEITKFVPNFTHVVVEAEKSGDSRAAGARQIRR